MPLIETKLPKDMATEKNNQHYGHEKTLVDIVPTLHNHAVEPYPTLADWRHEIAVVKSTDSAENALQHNEEYPFVVFEVNAFALAATTEHVE